MAVGMDLNGRHGAIHSIGQVCLGLISIGVQVDASVLDAITQIEPTVRLLDYYFVLYFCIHLKGNTSCSAGDFS